MDNPAARAFLALLLCVQVLGERQGVAVGWGTAQVETPGRPQWNASSSSRMPE